MKNTVLLTGVSGFVGSHLATHLSRAGYPVHCLARIGSQFPKSIIANSNIVIHQSDLSGSFITETLHRVRPAVVIHLASLFLAEHRPEDIGPMVQANLLLGIQLLESMRIVGCRKLINTGTSWQHYNQEVYNPVNLYAATKEAFQRVAEYYVQAQNLQILTLKLFDTYGENDTRRKLIPLILTQLGKTEPLEMSPGKQRIDFCHISDVCTAYEMSIQLILSDAFVSQEFAVRSGQSCSPEELVAHIRRYSRLPFPVSMGKRGYREREVMQPWEGGECLPGWEPKVSIFEWLVSEVRRRETV